MCHDYFFYLKLFPCTAFIQLYCFKIIVLFTYKFIEAIFSLCYFHTIGALLPYRRLEGHSNFVLLYTIVLVQDYCTVSYNCIASRLLYCHIQLYRFKIIVLLHTILQWHILFVLLSYNWRFAEGAYSFLLLSYNCTVHSNFVLLYTIVQRPYSLCTTFIQLYRFKIIVLMPYNFTV